MRLRIYCVSFTLLFFRKILTKLYEIISCLFITAHSLYISEYLIVDGSDDKHVNTQNT